MLTVGQKLWYVPCRHHHARRSPGVEVRVDKVGRKWATISTDLGIAGSRIDYGRIDMKTLYADGQGYSSPGRCFMSSKHYERKIREGQLWSAFRAAVGHNLPDHVTEHAIRAAANYLHIELPPMEDSNG